MVAVRQSPSGPIIFEAGAGMTTRRNFVPVTGVTIGIPDAGDPSYFGTDGLDTGASAPSLSDVRTARVYRADLSAFLDYSSVSQTCQVTLGIDYSLDAGANWSVWKDQSFTVNMNAIGGGPPNLASNGLFRAAVEVRSNVDAIPVVDAGSLRIRGRVNGQPAIANQKWQGGIGGGLTSISLAEELA